MPIVLDLNDTGMVLDAAVDIPVFKYPQPKFPQASLSCIPQSFSRCYLSIYVMYEC